MSIDTKDTAKISELLDAINDLQRHVNVLTTSIMYLGMAIDHEKLKSTVEALKFEATNDKFDNETQKLFLKMANELDLRARSGFIS